MAKINAAFASSDARWKVASALDREGNKLPPLQLPVLAPLLSNGLSRGAIAEFTGIKSSGKTSISWHVIAQATSLGEICAVVDLNNNFFPGAAAAAGAKLDRVLWTRCQGNAEHAMRTADLLLHAGGFGVVLLDLCEAGPRVLNRIPLSYWFRFRRAIEHTPTILLLCAESPQAKSCSSHTLQIKSKPFCWSGKTPFSLLRGLEVNAAQRKVTAIRPPRAPSSSDALFIQTVA